MVKQPPPPRLPPPPCRLFCKLASYFHVWKWTHTVKPQTGVWTGWWGVGEAFLPEGPELGQKGGQWGSPCLGNRGLFSRKAAKAERIKSRKIQTQNTRARRCPRCRGSNHGRRSQAEHWKPGPYSSSTQASDLSPLECRILHNSPSITRTPSRPALRRVASGLFCFCGLRNSRQLLLARARLRLAKKSKSSYQAGVDRGGESPAGVTDQMTPKSPTW